MDSSKTLEYVVQHICIYVMLTDVVQVMLVSLGLCLPSATTSDVSLFGTVPNKETSEAVAEGEHKPSETNIT